MGSKPDSVWWAEEFRIVPAAGPTIVTSSLVPNLAVVREVQIQAAPNDEIWAVDITINIAFGTAENPTRAEVQAAEQIIDWRWIKLGKEWRAIAPLTNERWPCYKTLHGSNLRFMVAAVTGHATGAVARVGVLYDLP